MATFFLKLAVRVYPAMWQLGACELTATCKEINDRDDELVYRHEVWRMEHELKELNNGWYFPAGHG